MGVRGLTTYVRQNEHLFLKNHVLYDSTIVIDGYSLAHQIFGSCNNQTAFGGDYDHFAAYIILFFKNLRKCKIDCYVLLDGSYEKRKLKTIYDRLKSRILTAATMDPVTQAYRQLVPVCFSLVFLSVLKEMNVKYTICEFEADNEIAAVARLLDCPVLSFDSDFFIYNVKYIPTPSLYSAPIQCKNDKGTYYAMECKIYKPENAIKCFGITNDMLPLLATLTGNDYIQRRVFKLFFAHLKMPKGNNEVQKSIKAVLKFLENETVDSAVSKIIGRIKKEDKKKIFNKIKENIESYSECDAKSLDAFNLRGIKKRDTKVILSDIEINDNDEGTDNSSSCDEGDCSEDCQNTSEDDEADVDDGHDIDDSGLPTWFSGFNRQYLVPHSWLSLYALHLDIFFPQPEDYSDEDAALCILPYKRYAFDLMTDYAFENFLYVSRDTNAKYKKVIVGREYSTPRSVNIAFSKLSESELKHCFESFYKVRLPDLDLNALNCLPTNFRIIMLSILWWVKHCNVPKSYVQALLVSYIMLDVIEEKTGIHRNNDVFLERNSTKLSVWKKREFKNELEAVFLNKNKVMYEDAMIAASVLIKHFKISDELLKRPKLYDCQRIHRYAQFQLCLKETLLLNWLCRYYFCDNSIYKFYNGTFVYNISTLLGKQNDTVAFLKQYLNGAHTVLNFFDSLNNVYEDLAKKLGVVEPKFAITMYKKKKKKKEREQIELPEKFEFEVTI